MIAIEKFKALVLEEHRSKIHSGVKKLSFSDLPQGEVTLKVEYSTLNYKDALILNGLGQMVKNYPMIPGIDCAGIVVDSQDPRFPQGSKAILTGWRYGEVYWGGFSQYLRAKAEHLVPCPENLSTKQAMALGTAGLTAAMALNEMEDHGLTPSAGQVIVTGAAGGVGSLAVLLLAANGYHVAASTGRPQLHRYLNELGAKEIIDRRKLTEGPQKLLDHELWAGAIDSVGSTVLAKILTQMRNRSTVAACGLAGGSDLPANLMPFLLRGVRIIGIASSDCPQAERIRAWQRMAQEIPQDKLEKAISVCALSDIPDLSTQILQGLVQGRIVVDVQK